MHGLLLQRLTHAASAVAGLPCWFWEDSLPTTTCQLRAARPCSLPSTTPALRADPSALQGQRRLAARSPTGSAPVVTATATALFAVLISCCLLCAAGGEQVHNGTGPAETCCTC